MNAENRIRIVEVGPRDGLQNEAAVLPVADRLAFIGRLTAGGCRDIEVASFVNPKRVPPMAHAADVVAGLPAQEGVRYISLVPNRRGLDDALAAGARAIAVFTAASETFSLGNVGRGIKESLEEFRVFLPTARAASAWVRGYVSTAFHCPYEGVIEPDRTAEVVSELLAMGVDEVSVGDTIGQADPDDVSRLTDALLAHLPRDRFAYHFHDTRGTALANVERALTFGITTFDAATGGLGGCPFAPGATGNLATESLVQRMAERGIATGLDLNAIAETGRWIRSRLNSARSVT